MCPPTPACWQQRAGRLLSGSGWTAGSTRSCKSCTPQPQQPGRLSRWGGTAPRAGGREAGGGADAEWNRPFRECSAPVVHGAARARSRQRLNYRCAVHKRRCKQRGPGSVLPACGPPHVPPQRPRSSCCPAGCIQPPGLGPAAAGCVPPAAPLPPQALGGVSPVGGAQQPNVAFIPTSLGGRSRAPSCAPQAAKPAPPTLPLGHPPPAAAHHLVSLAAQHGHAHG